MPGAAYWECETVMRNDRFIVLCVLGVLAGVLAGCQSAESDVAQATSRARRLYDRAQSLLNDTAYKVSDDGQFAPLTKVVSLAEPDGMAGPLVRGQINPMVDKALDEAVADLEKALAASGQPEYDRILGQAMLARLYALRGYRHAFEAAESRRQAAQAASNVQNAAVNMSAYGKRIANLDQLLAIKGDTITSMASGAESEISDLTQKIAKAQGDIAVLAKEKDELSKANAGLLERARKLDTESLNIDPVKGVDVFDKAQTLRDTAGKNAARIDQIENSISILEASLVDLKASKAAAELQLAQARKMNDARDKVMASRRSERTAEVAKLDAAQKEAEQSATEGVEAIKAAGAADAKALDAYAKALETYEKYQQATDPYAGDRDAAPFLKPDAGILSMMGDTHVARGEVRVRMLLLQQRLAQAVAKTSELWSALPTKNSVPAAVSELDDYLADAAKVREDAQHDFRWAAKVFDKAGDLVEGKLRWTYTLNKVAANVSLYRLSGDAAAKQEALSDLDALGGQEQSPNIYPAAMDFRSKLDAPPLLAEAQ